MVFDGRVAPTDWPLTTACPPYDGKNRYRWARALGVTERAIDLLLQGDVIDLHVDTFLWKRLIGYDPRIWHVSGPHRARYFCQADLPRLIAAGVTGAAWILTTNPWRTPRGRLRALVRNYRLLTELLEGPDAQCAIVSTLSQYRHARSQGKHAAFLGIQGANALSDSAADASFPLERLLLVTLVHLTDSDIGHTSFRFRSARSSGLLARGYELVATLEAQNVLLDLAHASTSTFWDVVRAHDPNRPLLVSHGAFAGLSPHWRNIDDRQAKAIATSGGLIGVLYHGPFLGGAPWGGSVRQIAKHIAYGVRLLGAEHLCLGSDWDGLIATPVDMPTCLELPRLVQALLDEGLPEDAIVGILGQNVLNVLQRIRP